MKLTTTEQIAGEQISETLGLVRGNTIRARHLGRDVMAGLRNVFPPLFDTLSSN